MFDTVTHHWSQLLFNKAKPTGRDECAVTVYKDKVYFFSGYAAGSLSDYWEATIDPFLYKQFS